MNEALAFGVGVLLGGAGIWWVMRSQVQLLTDELAIANDRLYGAWRDGNVVPSREQVRPEPPEPLPPLPEEALAWVGEFSDPEARKDTSDFIRQKLAQGWSLARIRDHLNQ